MIKDNIYTTNTIFWGNFSTQRISCVAIPDNHHMLSCPLRANFSCKSSINTPRYLLVRPIDFSESPTNPFQSTFLFVGC